MKNLFHSLTHCCLLMAMSLLYYSANAQTISAGSYFTTVICNDGTLMAWGNNGSSELGIGNNNVTNYALPVNTVTSITQIAKGSGAHCLALAANGDLWAWGFNVSGQLGDGTTNTTNTPILAIPSSGFVKISKGFAFSHGIKANGTLWAWGFNGDGQLGIGNNNNSSVPVQVTSIPNVLQVKGGLSHCVILKSDGTVWTSGYNLHGQLGNGTNTTSNAPVPTGLDSIVAVAAGRDFSIALKVDGTV